MDNYILASIITLVLGVGIYAYFPRKCKRCDKWMRIKDDNENIIHICKKCGDEKDTGIGVGDNNP